MADDIVESVGLAIALLIIGVVMVILGAAFQSPLLAVVGVILAGALPFLGVIMTIVEKI